MAVMVTRARGNGRTPSLIAALMVITAAAGLSGATVMATVGLASGSFAALSRGLIVVMACASLAVARYRRDRPWQLDTETQIAWLERENLNVALWNGLVLGAGFLSRIGFWLWWTLPVLVFAGGSAGLGIAAGAAYGVTRLGVSSLVAIPSIRSARDFLPRAGAFKRRTAFAADLSFAGATTVALVAGLSLVMH